MNMENAGWHNSFLGTFVPALDEDGKYLYNLWGEQKFCAPDGMHRCVTMVSRDTIMIRVSGCG
jgi:hypothetical protein